MSKIEISNVFQAVEEINNIFDQQQLLNLATQKFVSIKELVRKTKEQTALEYYLIGSCANRCHCLCTIMNNPDKYGSWEKEHKAKYLNLLGKSYGYLSSIMNYACWTGLTDYAELGPSVLMSAARTMKTYLDLEGMYNPQIQLPKYDVTAVYDFCDGKTIVDNLKDFLKEIARTPSKLYYKTLRKVAESKGDQYKTQLSEVENCNMSGRQATDLVNALRGENVDEKRVTQLISEIKEKSGGYVRKVSDKDTNELLAILNEQKQNVEKLLSENGVSNEVVSTVIQSFDYSLHAVGNYYVTVSGVQELQLGESA